MSRKIITVAASALWLVCAALGFVVLMNYQTTAGASGQVSRRWPEKTGLRPEPGVPNLVVFMHPKCACSAASMEELNRLMARAAVKPRLRLVFYKPTQTADDWTKTPLRQSAALIKGAEIIDDTDGNLAQLFGADTSGDCLLYDRQGRLLFSGGITPGRGHQGDNAGADALLQLLSGGNASIRQTPVYGCSLGGKCSKLESDSL